MFIKPPERRPRNPTPPRGASPGTGLGQAARAGGVRAGPCGCCRTNSRPSRSPLSSGSWGCWTARTAAGHPVQAEQGRGPLPPRRPRCGSPSCCPSARLARSLRTPSPLIAAAPFPHYGPQPLSTPPSPGATGGAPQGTPRLPAAQAPWAPQASLPRACPLGAPARPCPHSPPSPETLPDPPLTGRRGAISAEQQWQKNRPGCGDASAIFPTRQPRPPRAPRRRRRPRGDRGQRALQTRRAEKGGGGGSFVI